MNTVIVATYKNGTQRLFTGRFIFSIGSEYKRAWRRMNALTEWCAWRSIVALDLYNMDGTLNAWILKCDNPETLY